ncbi:MAG: hypothetical protein QOJ43_2743 [Gaiellaceae bacterium]|nr:hypothetical protein [Gaiellaceae bacterium]
MSIPPAAGQWTRRGRAASLLLALVALTLVVSLLLLGPASAGQVEPEQCAYGAISAIGPVDAEGNGDTTPDVACMTPEP